MLSGPNSWLRKLFTMGCFAPWATTSIGGPECFEGYHGLAYRGDSSLLEAHWLLQLTRIRSYFLRESVSLRTLSLVQLPNLQEIGSNVLGSCPHLRDVYLRDLPKLATIGLGFAAKCSALRTLKLSRLPALTVISSYFVSQCTSLRHVCLVDLPNLEELVGI